MPITIQFRTVIASSSIDSTAQLKSLVAQLLPSPLPADLEILVSTKDSITLTYSQSFTNSDSALQAALDAIKKELPS